MSLESRASEFLDGFGLGHSVAIIYSGRFKPFNANVRKVGSGIVFSLSSSWRDVSEEITLGLVQNLLIRLLKLKAGRTLNIDLYNNFARSIQSASPRTSTDAELEFCFNRVNRAYFSELLDMPNFEWHSSIRRLASYNHYTDTVSVSDLFRGMPELLDYLMYHELLHKKLKFSGSSGRALHHGKKFRMLEHSFKDAGVIEKRIDSVLRRRRF